jgi:hypothetical protein
MEDREMPEMHKYGESKMTQIMVALYIMSVLERDVQNFRLLDFC